MIPERAVYNGQRDYMGFESRMCPENGWFVTAVILSTSARTFQD
jgi:hypothetical protein